MKTNTAIGAAMVCAVLLCGAGCADKGGLPSGAAALDNDRDGKISRAEFIARYKEKGMGDFSRMDKSGDGFLDRNEAGNYPNDYWDKTESNDEP